MWWYLGGKIAQAAEEGVWLAALIVVAGFLTPLFFTICIWFLKT